MIRQGRSFSGHERNCCFLNTGNNNQTNKDSNFATVSAVSGLDFPDDARAVVSLDWDGDGDLDLWLANRSAPRLRFLRNNQPKSNNHIAFILKGNGTNCNRDAIGARVEIFTGEEQDLKQIKTVNAGSGLISQTSRRLSFGIGKTKRVKRVLIRWPDGSTQEFSPPAINTCYLVNQGDNEANIRQRPQPKIEIADSLPAPATDFGLPIRVPLAAPLPLPEINYLDHNYQAKMQPSGRGRRILINLISRQSPQCAAELWRLQNEAPELKRAGINLLALEVDHLSSPDSNNIKKNQLLPENFAFPFRYGFASPTLIADLKRIHNLSLPLEYPLPIPSSFLIDTQGRVTTIYKGAVNPRQLALDAVRETDNFYKSLVQSMPFSGRFCDDPQLLRPLKENFALKMLHGGRRLEGLGRTQEALSYYYEVVKILPNAAIANYHLGEAHYKLRHLEATLVNLKQALKKDPGLIPARKLLAHIHLVQGEAQAAALQLLIILKENPQDAESLANLGVAYIALGRPEMGRKKLEEAQKTDPKNASINFNLGALYLSEKNFDAAEKAFTKTLLLQRDYPGIKYQLGLLAESQGNPIKAMDFYEQELKSNPTHQKAIIKLGELYENQKAR